MKTRVTIAFNGAGYVVVLNYNDHCRFETYELAEQFCRDMGYEILPLNSKLAMRILNPTDPRLS